MHSKGNYKQGKKINLRMGENTCEWCDKQGLKSPKYRNGSYNSITKKQTTQSENEHKT